MGQHIQHNTLLTPTMAHSARHVSNSNTPQEHIDVGNDKKNFNENLSPACSMTHGSGRQPDATRLRLPPPPNCQCCRHQGANLQSDACMNLSLASPHIDSYSSIQHPVLATRCLDTCECHLHGMQPPIRCMHKDWLLPSCLGHTTSHGSVHVPCTPADCKLTAA